MDINLGALGFRGGGVQSKDQFDDPFLSHSNIALPTTLKSTLDLSLFLYTLSPQYAAAGRRLFAYYVTDFDYPDKGDTKEKRTWDEFIHDQICLPAFFMEAGDEHTAYGNGFYRIHFPFDRWLKDHRNGSTYSLDMFDRRRIKYHWHTMKYEVPDPKDPMGRKTIALSFFDLKSKDLSRIKLRKVNPRYVTIQHSLISGNSRYIYEFEPEIIDDVKRGMLQQINEMPQPMLKAIAKNEDFLFEPDVIFHLKQPAISGVSYQGWGLPGPLAHFRNIYQLHVYRKIDESVALDYMIPFRLFSPASTESTSQTMMELVDGSKWKTAMSKLIADRRRNPFSIHSVAFPIEYQELGANGKLLTPKENLDWQTAALYEGMGLPIELFKGTLSFQQVPMALRLFEQSFNFIHTMLDGLTKWVSRRIQAYLNWPRIPTNLQPPQLADSMEKKQLMMQLAGMGEVSRETAYGWMGIDDDLGEFQKRMDEDMARQRVSFKQQQQLQREMEAGTLQSGQQQQTQPGQGSIPGMGAPGQGGGGAVTPVDVNNDAQALAEYWLSLDVGNRRQAMKAAEVNNPQVFAMAKEIMNKMRQAGESEGRAAVNTQFQGGGPGGGAPPPQ